MAIMTNFHVFALFRLIVAETWHSSHYDNQANLMWIEPEAGDVERED